MAHLLVAIVLAVMSGGPAPGSAEAHYRAGLWNEQHARFDQAVSEMKLAVKLAPDTSLYVAGLGDAAIKAGQLAEARQALAALRRLAIDHDVVPAQIRILAADLARAEQLAAARGAGLGS